MFPPELLARANAIVTACTERGVMVATAESCTGGLVAGLLTEVPGSSAAVERGFVTYSNEAKMKLLGVEAALLARHGAVSAACAQAMADGALARSRASLAVSITGIAGPGGGSADKPVGLVHFAIARRGEPTRTLERRFGDQGRSAIRLAAIGDALGLIERALQA